MATDNIDMSYVLSAIACATREELDAISEATRERSRSLRTIAVIVNKANFTPGTRVVTRGLKPKYLNGLHGEVIAGFVKRKGDILVRIDSEYRDGAERYVSSVTGTCAIPASALIKEES